jgi:methyltransferase
MGLNTVAFLALLATVGASRLIELAISRRHQRVLRALGAPQVPDPHFHWMVVLHTAILAGAGLEVVVFHRPMIRMLAVAAGTVFMLAEGLRWWTIQTLGRHWNVHVMNSTHLGIVSSGPFRFVRHPNYAAVFIELIALPLIHTAWLTALVGSVAHLWVLSRRIFLEDVMLLADPTYRAEMAHKPRFLPRPPRIRARPRVAAVLFAMALAPQLARGEPVTVRHAEGIVHGFLVLRAFDGTALADGDLIQTARGTMLRRPS